ncbi:uncharacterized protein LOC126847364 [Adelges cooleyi]|uniref:uncharacterized protein LOC126847364 n=1 Tax=Adelges cooleyi TaxID=133065 RepID=UPI0021804A73|nr:uncharacterized protein LOC126847364 [Adelges cooleyi]
METRRSIANHHKNISQWPTFQTSESETAYIRQSSTHETYQRFDEPKALDDREKKRKEFEEYLWKTATEKVLGELAEKTNQFCTQQSQFETTYSSAYQKDGFKLKEIGSALDEELCAKYPLYGTVGISVPVNRYKFQKMKQPVHKPLDQLFKKNTSFTNYMCDV